MKMQESPEDYLEAILVLSRKLGNVRSIDVASHLGYSKPSISVAMKHLRENGCIIVNESGFIYLTEKGHAIADMIYERHTFLAGWLMALGIDETTATADACRMEHVISPKSFAAIKKYVTESGIKYP